MKTDPRRFAPIGLVLSGLSFLTILGILVVRAFAAVGLYTPPDAELLNRILYIALAVFISGFAVYALLDPDRVRKFLTGRQARYGSNSRCRTALSSARKTLAPATHENKIGGTIETPGREARQRTRSRT